MINLPLRIVVVLSFFTLFWLTSCSSGEAYCDNTADQLDDTRLLLSRIQSLEDSTLHLSKALLDSAQVVFTKENDHFALGITYDLQASLAMDKGNLEESANYSLLASTAYQTVDSLLPALISIGNAGINFLELNAIVRTTEAFQKRHELAILLKDTFQIAWSLNGLSQPYHYSYNSHQTLAYLNEANELNKYLDNHQLEAAILLNIGNVYNQQKDYDQAIAYYQQSHCLSMEINFENLTWLAINNLANIYLKQGKYSSVIETLKGWDSGRFENINQNHEPLIHYNISKAYLGQGEIAMAEYHKNLNCELSNAFNNSGENINCIELTGLLAEAKGDSGLALTKLKEYHRLKEEVEGVETDNKLQAVKESYDVKVRDQEIAELKEKELLRKEQEEKQRSAIIGFIVLSGLTIIGIVGTIWSSSQSRIAKQKKEIAEAQLHFLQARMSPHFVFNALNGIQNQILQADPFSAYEYIGKFAGLLRVITNTTSKPEILLSDEIALLQNYLDLEQLRFRDGFSFTVDAEEELSSLNPMIPAMMIQPVIENAIIHGLSESRKKGTISVGLSLQKYTVRCVVTDNGIGRDASAQISKQEGEQHLSISTANLKKRFKALERLGYPMEPLTTTDLFDGDKASGTQVTLYLPIIDMSL